MFIPLEYVLVVGGLDLTSFRLFLILLQFSSSMNPLDHLQYSQMPNAGTSAMKYWNGSKQQPLSPDTNANKNGRNDTFQQRINQRKFNNFLSIYEDGIAKDIRELELRIESELEEPNKKLTGTEEVIVSPN